MCTVVFVGPKQSFSLVSHLLHDVPLEADLLQKLELPNFQTLSVNFCTTSFFELTDRAVNMDLYYTSRLIKLRSLEVFRTTSVDSSETSSDNKAFVQ